MTKDMTRPYRHTEAEILARLESSRGVIGMRWLAVEYAINALLNPDDPIIPDDLETHVRNCYNLPQEHFEMLWEQWGNLAGGAIQLHPIPSIVLDWAQLNKISAIFHRNKFTVLDVQVFPNHHSVGACFTLKWQ